MRKKNFANKNVEPKVYADTQTDEVNQKFFYINTRIEKINSQFNEVNRTIGVHDQIHHTFSKQLEEQDENTRKLQLMHEDLVEVVEEKSDIQQELIKRVGKSEEDTVVLQQQLQALSEAKDSLTEQLISLEAAKYNLYTAIDEHSNQLKEQTDQLQKVKNDQSNQNFKHDELVQLVGVQAIDHEDLLKRVKENEAEQKQLQISLEDLIDKTAELALQHREQEKMHLDLYTQLIQLKAVSSEASMHMKKSISKLNAELKELHKAEKTPY
jgi:chromosome segregation ATPase